MELSPVKTESTEPCYPERRASLRRVNGRWIRRVGVAVAASAAMWLFGGGCISPGGDVVDPEFFFCESGSSSQIETMTAPGTAEGQLCGIGEARTSFDVTEERSFQLDLEREFGSADDLAADIVDSEGNAVATATLEYSEVVTLSPGTYEVVVTSASEDHCTFSVTLGNPQ